jgi:hypothetical protein
LYFLSPLYVLSSEIATGAEEEAEPLHQVAGVVELAGRIYVANGGTRQVLVHDAEGRPIGSFGRRGDGPDELRTLSALVALPGGLAADVGHLAAPLPALRRARPLLPLLLPRPARRRRGAGGDRAVGNDGGRRAARARAALQRDARARPAEGDVRAAARGASSSRLLSTLRNPLS